MKSKLFFFLFLLFPIYLFSQGENDTIVYLDSIFQKTEKENHVYYRIIRDYHLNKEKYKIEEYYKSGKIKKEGFSTDKDVYKYFGPLTSYYENGNLEEKVSYKDFHPEGLFFSWHENGSKRVEGTYFVEVSKKIKVRTFKIQQYWDENGIQKVIDGNGLYDEIEGKVYSTGNLKNGLKDGLWEGFDENLNITFSENYKDGKFISGISIDKNLVERNYKEINVKSLSQNDLNSFYAFIGKNFKVPEDESINGKIILTFLIDKKGTLKDIEIIRGITDETDEEAIRVIQLYDKWQVAQSRGIDIDETYTFPISIIGEGNR